MIAPRALTLVHDPDESLRAWHAFRTGFAAHARVFRDVRLGWQGGGVTGEVLWNERAGIWGVFEHHPPSKVNVESRFWNCFGLTDPTRASMLAITVELNPPHRGDSRHTAGVFLRDGNGKTCVGHSGKVGGGRAGIGLKAFRDYARQLPWQEIQTPRGPREVIVFGSVDDPNFPEALAGFTRTVAEFKEAAVAGGRQGHS